MLSQRSLDTLAEIKRRVVPQRPRVPGAENRTFDDDAIDYIVEKAVEYKLGARGLRSICEAVMTDAMFELPSEKDVKQFKVTRSFVEEKLEHTQVSKLKAA